MSCPQEIIEALNRGGTVESTPILAALKAIEQDAILSENEHTSQYLWQFSLQGKPLQVRLEIEPVTQVIELSVQWGELGAHWVQREGDNGPFDLYVRWIGEYDHPTDPEWWLGCPAGIARVV